MSTLLIDVGNTRIKWALLKAGGELQRQRASVYRGWTALDIEQTILGTARSVEWILAVSVGPEFIKLAIRKAARANGISKVTFVESAQQLGAVTTRYTEAWRLGTDRLVAAVGAHAIAGRRSFFVVDVGTAMTLDIVDAKGVHLGGAIIPGPELMVSSLLDQTNGIEKRAAATRRSSLRNLFARNTRAAVDSGARFAVAASIDRAVVEAKARLGHTPVVLLTGGAAPLIRPLLRTRGIQDVPDLVLRGLAGLAKTPLR